MKRAGALVSLWPARQTWQATLLSERQAILLTDAKELCDATFSWPC